MVIASVKWRYQLDGAWRCHLGRPEAASVSSVGVRCILGSGTNKGHVVHPQIGQIILIRNDHVEATIIIDLGLMQNFGMAITKKCRLGLIVNPCLSNSSSPPRRGVDRFIV